MVSIRSLRNPRHPGLLRVPGLFGPWSTHDRLTIDEDHRINIELCHVTGTVVWPEGTYDPVLGTIAWDPPIEANAVAVQDFMTSNVKWAIVNQEGQGGMEPPLVYGEVPAGALQAFPPGDREPEAVTSGDTIMVSPLSGTMEYEGQACTAVGVGYVQ